MSYDSIYLLLKPDINLPALICRKVKNNNNSNIIPIEDFWIYNFQIGDDFRLVVVIK